MSIRLGIVSRIAHRQTTPPEILFVQAQHLLLQDLAAATPRLAGPSQSPHRHLVEASARLASLTDILVHLCLTSSHPVLTPLALCALLGIVASSATAPVATHPAPPQLCTSATLAAAVPLEPLLASLCTPSQATLRPDITLAIVQQLLAAGVITSARQRESVTRTLTQIAAEFAPEASPSSSASTATAHPQENSPASPNNGADRGKLRRAALEALAVALDTANPLEHSYLSVHVLVAECSRLRVPLQEIAALRFTPGEQNKKRKKRKKKECSLVLHLCEFVSMHDELSCRARHSCCSSA